MSKRPPADHPGLRERAMIRRWPDDNTRPASLWLHLSMKIAIDGPNTNWPGPSPSCRRAIPNRAERDDGSRQARL